jgi:tRNA pseudouridine55 synthase
LQPKRIKRDISGILLLDKPIGISSNQALQQVKRFYQAAKAGHTGSLDPLATGLLPICFGEATKFSHFLLDADKSYLATMVLGSTTTTGDAEGDVLAKKEVNVDFASVEAALKAFTGPISQIPPMYSALKHEGKNLYEYARAGIEIVREARNVIIYSLELNSFDEHIIEMTVVCSKGTYIRTLAEDIGHLLGCGAHLKALRRLTSGDFSLNQAFTIAQLEAMTPEQRDAILLPTDAAIENLPRVDIDQDSAFYLMRGQEVWKSGLNLTTQFRVYNHLGVFLGLCHQNADGKIAPRRLVSSK